MSRKGRVIPFFPMEESSSARREGTSGPCVLPLLAQVDQLGHVIAQLDVIHLTCRVRVPVAGGQMAATGRGSPEGRPHSAPWEDAGTALLCLCWQRPLFSFIHSPGGRILKLNKRLFWFFSVVEMEPRALLMLSKTSTTEFISSPKQAYFNSMKGTA